MAGNGLASIKNLDTLTEAGFNEKQARAILQMMSQDAASKADLERSTTELKRDIETVRSELKRDIETFRSELKRDIKELDTKIENVRAELKRDIKELENKITLKMAMLSGGIVLTILTCLVTLARLGFLRPA